MERAKSPLTAPIGVALLGTGAIAASHARAISLTPGLELRAVAGREEGRTAAFITRTGIAKARPMRVDDAIAHPSVSLVVIATPTGTHVELGGRAFAAGRHVLVEKPIDVDLERTLRFAEEARRAEQRGLVAAAVSQYRFDPAARHLRAAVDAGRLGRLTSGTATVPWWRSQAYYDASPWRGTIAMDGGGALMNQGIHSLDLLLWFLGEPRRVSASAGTVGHTGIEVEDVLGAVLEFDGGAIATVHASTAAYPGLSARVQVLGTAGSAVLEQGGLAYLHLADADPRGAGDMGLGGDRDQAPPELAPRRGAHRDPVNDPSGLARQYADLVEAVARDRRPGMTVQDAAVTLRTIDAIYRAAASGRAIDLPWRGDRRGGAGTGTETA